MQITSTRCKTGWSSLGQMQCGTRTDAASFVKSVAVGMLTLTAAKEVTCVAKELTCLTRDRRQPDAQKEDPQNKHLQRFVSCLAIQHDHHHHPASSKTNVKHVQGKSLPGMRCETGCSKAGDARDGKRCSRVTGLLLEHLPICARPSSKSPLLNRSCPYWMCISSSSCLLDAACAIHKLMHKLLCAWLAR